MNRVPIAIVATVCAAVGIGALLACAPVPSHGSPATPQLGELAGEQIMLPAAADAGAPSVERALLERRSVRQYQDAPISLAELGQLLWAAQGVTHGSGLRTAPSAGALYPLEVYVAVGNVDGVAAGVYHYNPQQHELARIEPGDRREALSQAALGQDAVRDAAAVIVLAAVYERTTGKYGERGVRYVHIEVGAAAQNVALQAVALGLGTVYVGAFHDDQVAGVLSLRDEEVPLCLLPIGRPAQ